MTYNKLIIPGNLAFMFLDTPRNTRKGHPTISLRIRPSYSDDTFGFALTLPSQLLALAAHGECPIEHVCGLLISNSCTKRIFLASIDIILVSA